MSTLSSFVIYILFSNLNCITFSLEFEHSVAKLYSNKHNYELKIGQIGHSCLYLVLLIENTVSLFS